MTLDTIHGVSDPVENDAETSPQQRKNPGLGVTVVVLAALGVAGLALSRDPGVQAAVRGVARDGRMRSAAGELRTTIAAAWREHGGTEAMANAVGRGMRVVRPQ